MIINNNNNNNNHTPFICCPLSAARKTTGKYLWSHFAYRLQSSVFVCSFPTFCDSSSSSTLFLHISSSSLLSNSPLPPSGKPPHLYGQFSTYLQWATFSSPLSSPHMNLPPHSFQFSMVEGEADWVASPPLLLLLPPSPEIVLLFPLDSGLDPYLPHSFCSPTFPTCLFLPSVTRKEDRLLM